jgi:hypothetical protein
MPGLILNRPAPIAPAGEAFTPRPCLCERLAAYGMLCRWCDWRIMTPPPLEGTADPVDRHSHCPERSPASIADLTYSVYDGSAARAAEAAAFSLRD